MSNVVKRRRETLYQFIRFAMVGGLATSVHYASALLLYYYVGLTSVMSNVGAYFVALCVSLIGQSLFTFGQRISKKVAVRFAVVSLSSAIATIAMTELLTKLLNLPFWLSLIIVITIIPLLTFLFQKTWVYKESA